MRLDSNGVVLESSGQFTESEFTIGDPRLILEYLRKSVYSNPKRVLVQELMSNAKDAHKEVGKENTPIVVNIPTRFNLNWSVTDYGPGISPTRMKEVFIQFGVSTKRGVGQHATDDGSQLIGGFGIGSKSPWAYTDSFTIITKAQEGNEIVERTYIAIIGEDRRNKLMEFDGSRRVCEANESTGTTITVPVKIEDIHYFNQYTVEVSQYWNVRPDLKNSAIDYATNDVIFEGTNWQILKKSVIYDQNKVVALVGQIPYIVNLNSLNNFPANLRNMFAANIIMEFGIGELSVALSRENLQYDEKTQKAILDRLFEICDIVKKDVSDVVAECESLWKANVHWRKVCNLTEFAKVISHVVWTDKNTNTAYQVNGREINTNYGDFIRVYPKYNSSKYKRSGDIHVHEKTLLAYCSDGDSIPKRKVDYLLQQNPHLDSIQVLSYTLKELAEKKCNSPVIDMLPVLDAVDLCKLDVPKVKREYERQAKVDGYEFMRIYWLGGNFDFSTFNKEDVVIVEMLRKNARNISDQQMANIYNMVKHVQSQNPSFKTPKFIGVPTSFLNKVKSFEKLDAFIDRLSVEVDKLYKIDYEDSDFVNKSEQIAWKTAVIEFRNNIWSRKDCKDKIDQNTDMYKLMELLDLRDNTNVKHIDYNEFYRIAALITKDKIQPPANCVSQKLQTINKLWSSAKSRYHFIFEADMDYFTYPSDKQTQHNNHIINYINRM
jgi:hypothetical protein